MTKVFKIVKVEKFKDITIGTYSNIATITLRNISKEASKPVIIVYDRVSGKQIMNYFSDEEVYPDKEIKVIINSYVPTNVNVLKLRIWVGHRLNNLWKPDEFRDIDINLKGGTMETEKILFTIIGLLTGLVVMYLIIKYRERGKVWIEVKK